VDDTLDKRDKGQSANRASPLFRLLIILVFALLILAGGAWLHYLSTTQHAHLNMPPFIVAALVTDIGLVFRIASLVTWVIGGIFLVSLIIHWFKEDFTQTR
jgi:hypothetical protein